MAVKKEDGGNIKPFRAQILIAEDSPTQAQQLSWLLEDAGYQVRLARNGDQAMASMQKHKPDLLITDVVMPEMDGYQLCKAVRSTFGMDVPVMLVTSLKSPSDVLKGLKAGADNFLTKPYQGDYLLDQVDYLLSNRKLRGRRKIELGIEIEFGGERHFITADRQQILDLLISTYHEAVYLNQELEQKATQLKTRVRQQTTLLRLANSLQTCTSMPQLLHTCCDILLSVNEVEAVWFSRQTADHDWIPEAGKIPYSKSAVQPPCRCLPEISDKGTLKAPAVCALSKALNLAQPHLCLPLRIDEEEYIALNMLLNADYGDFDEFRDLFNTICQQIETHFQRIGLLSELELKVEQRTRELKRSEQRFRAIVESELFGVLIATEQGDVIYQNHLAHTLLRFPKEQQLSLQNILTAEPASPPFCLPPDNSLLERPCAYRIQRADGSSVPVVLRLSHVDGDQHLWLGAFVDMTELREAETKVAHMQRMESIASLTGGIAHDFNNLLSVISGNTEVLLDETSNQQDIQKALSAINNAARSGAELTQQLLAFARRQPLAAEPVSISQVVAGLKQFIDRVIGNQIKVKVRCDQNVWPVFTDYSRLESALLNLSINARDAMPGGGTLTIEGVNCRDLDLRETLSDEAIKGDFVRVEVRDTGTGIPEHFISQVFEPFFTTKEEGKGTGIGLAMVYGFVKQCGGYLRVESSPGDTRFTLYFPPYHDDQPAELSGPSDSLPHGSGQTVLVVEDNPDVREIMVRHIRSLGYLPLEAEDADIAAQVLQQQAASISLVMTDLNLPGNRSGLDLARHTGQNWPELPVVLTTGSSVDTDQLQIKEMKRLWILRKPFRRHELARVIHQALASN